MLCWDSIGCFQTGADGDRDDDYSVSDGGDGGGEKYILMISVIMIMIDGVNDVDDEYLNSYLLGSQT